MYFCTTFLETGGPPSRDATGGFRKLLSTTLLSGTGIRGGWAFCRGRGSLAVLSDSAWTRMRACIRMLHPFRVDRVVVTEIIIFLEMVDFFFF